MGIAAIGLGIGGIGVWAALFHVFCHTLVKSSLFLQMAVVRQVYDSYRINRIGDYIRINRVGAVGLLTGMVVLLAFPPSPLFVSELMILKQVITDRNWWLVAGLLLLMCIVIYSFGSRLIRLCYQPNQDRPAPLESPQGALMVGPVAARGRRRAGHVAAGTSATDHHRNRRVMKYYITDNTAPAVPLSEIPEASYAEFYADLPPSWPTRVTI